MDNTDQTFVIRLLLIALLTLGAGSGCRRKKPPPKPQVVITLDWEAWVHSKPGDGGRTIKESGPLFGTGPGRKPGAGSIVGHKSIDGKQYWGIIVRESGVPEDGPPTFELFVRGPDPAEELIHIYLTTKVLCQITVENFSKGVLSETVTKKRFARPFVFGPGEYHLEATKAQEKSEVETKDDT